MLVVLILEFAKLKNYLFELYVRLPVVILD